MCKSCHIDVSDFNNPVTEEAISVMDRLLEGITGVVIKDSNVKIKTTSSTCLPMDDEHREYLLNKFPNLANLRASSKIKDSDFSSVGNPVDDVPYKLDDSLVSGDIKETK